MKRARTCLRLPFRWRTPTLALTALLLVGVHRPAMADPYCSVQTDRLTVIAIGKPKRCTHLAREFLWFENLIGQFANWGPNTSPPPTRLYSLPLNDPPSYMLPTSNAERREKRVILARVLPGTDFNVAVMIDTEGDLPLRGLFSTHAQGLLNSGPFRRHPLWFQVGVPELINGIIIREDGSIRIASESYYVRVAENPGQHKPYDLLPLLQARYTKDIVTDLDWREFNLRSREWATFGLLTTAERRRQYHELAALMQKGVATEEAVNKAFGMPISQFAAEYESRKWRKELEYKIPAPATQLVVPEPVVLTDGQVKEHMQILESRAAEMKARMPSL